MNTIDYSEWAELFTPEDANLPDGSINNTSISDREILLNVIKNLQVKVKDENDNVLSLAEKEIMSANSQNHFSIKVFLQPEILVIIRLASPEYIDFDIDLNEIDNQKSLDVLLGFLQKIGKALNKEVKLRYEGADMHSFFYMYDSVTDKQELKKFI